MIQKKYIIPSLNCSINIQNFIEVLSLHTKDSHQKMMDEHGKNLCFSMVEKDVGSIKRLYSSN
jgi:hypothetical protein